MLDLNLIRETPELVRTALKNRQMDNSSVDEVLDELREIARGLHPAILSEQGLACKWLHSELDAFERVELLRARGPEVASVMQVTARTARR